MSKLNLGDSLILDSDYSTTEKKTGATWIDGKPIYRRVWKINKPSSMVAPWNYAHGISNLGAITGFVGYGNFSGIRRFLNFAYGDGSGTPILQWFSDVNITNSAFTFEWGDQFYNNLSSTDSIVIILYYTKTTD